MFVLSFFRSPMFASLFFLLKIPNLRPLLSITFPQGFRIFKNIGHPNSVSGGKKTGKRYLKSEQTDRQTDRQTNIWILRLIESIGPEGHCFEKNSFPGRPYWSCCGMMCGTGGSAEKGYFLSGGASQWRVCYQQTYLV